MKRSLHVLALACSSALSAGALAATHEPPLVGDPPGEKEFVGCHKYPESKRFRWGVRGEVGVAELVASLGEIGCQTILVGPQVASRAGKVTLEVPDLLTASEVYRLFYSSLEVLGLTVERFGRHAQDRRRGARRRRCRRRCSAASRDADRAISS